MQCFGGMISRRLCEKENSMSKKNAGILTLRVVVHNFNADMSLDKLDEHLHDALDAAELSLFQAHTKDEKLMYKIEAFSKPDGDKRHGGIGANVKNGENADFLSFEDSLDTG